MSDCKRCIENEAILCVAECECRCHLATAVVSDDFNRRLAAYCRAVGIPCTDAAVRAHDRNYAEFFRWISARAREFQVARGRTEHDFIGADNAEAFTRHCEAAAEAAFAAKGEA